MFNFLLRRIFAVAFWVQNITELVFRRRQTLKNEIVLAAVAN